MSGFEDQRVGHSKLCLPEFCFQAPGNFVVAASVQNFVLSEALGLLAKLPVTARQYQQGKIKSFDLAVSWCNERLQDLGR